MRAEPAQDVMFPEAYDINEFNMKGSIYKNV